ncbi:hypothetical protein SAMN05444274_105166 [Mariniphaga anaerophila]|uniref:Uncharacterized protein n=1 Tax=Mariniphaga anaerophila TaxID=1484053 RepID=A0A1M5BJD9_9BACT|nr:hypothetical protein [Mariniphaga anaerophila]SHF42372.1 hypothetical protein SAMN05444274_105166 [Mariniphaga anaerophila]
MKPKKIRRLIPSLLLLVFIAIFFCQCEKLFKSKDDDSNVAEGSYIATNASDPEFVKLVTKDGEIINVFGTRDANGMPDEVKQINITIEGDQEYVFLFNDNKEIETVIAANGTVFNFEWLSSEKVALFIDCNDGVNQINTEIDLNDLDAEKSARVNYNAPIRETGNFCYDIEFHPFVDAEDWENAGMLKSATASGTVYSLRTTSCGAPTNQQPYSVDVFDITGHVHIKKLYAEYVSKGVYSITIPSGTAPTIDPQGAIEKLTAILGPICDAGGIYAATLSPTMCVYLAAKLAATGIGIKVAPAVGVACTGVVAALSVYCATLGASGPPGSPSIMDKINEQKLLEDFKSQGEMRLYVRFHGLPSPILKAYTVREGVSAILNAELSANAKPSIRSLNLSPAAPAAKQSYTITVSVFCLPVGSTVSISMVGTDGWTQNSQYTVSSAEESAGTYKMSVVGAATGVRDEITVVVNTPDGQSITRNASLIFGG